MDAASTDASGKMTDEQFKTVADKTAEVRNAFIKP